MGVLGSALYISTVCAIAAAESTLHLCLKLLVYLVAVCTTTFLRVCVYPMPENPIVLFTELLARRLWRLNDRAHASNSTWARPYRMVLKIFQDSIAYRLLDVPVGMPVLKNVRPPGQPLRRNRETCVPGNSSFLAWSTIFTSACFSRGRISPPLASKRSAAGVVKSGLTRIP